MEMQNYTLEELELENKEGFRTILDEGNIVFRRLHEKGDSSLT
ncbi:MAG: hypothetical protein QXR57_08670 [Metallosphaera sp.]